MTKEEYTKNKAVYERMGECFTRAKSDIENARQDILMAIAWAETINATDDINAYAKALVGVDDCMRGILGAYA